VPIFIQDVASTRWTVGSGTDLILLLILFLLFSLFLFLLGQPLQKILRALLFQIVSGWNLVRLFFK